MLKALWVLHLPKKTKVLVSEGDRVSCGDELARGRKGEVFQSPTKGKITGISKNKIELCFKAWRVKGTGLGNRHKWGELSFVPEISFLDLDVSYKDRIVFVNKASPLFVSKAATLEIGGIICCIYEKELSKDDTLPILIVSDDGGIKLVIEKGQGVKCLLDVANGYLLVPK